MLTRGYFSARLPAQVSWALVRRGDDFGSNDNSVKFESYLFRCKLKKTKRSIKK
jgi:hypothetical protein